MLQQVMTNPGEIIFREVPVPEVKENQVLVKIMNIGVCGSDIHVYHGKHPFTKYPVTQGHEVSGEITLYDMYNTKNDSKQSCHIIDACTKQYNRCDSKYQRSYTKAIDVLWRLVVWISSILWLIVCCLSVCSLIVATLSVWLLAILRLSVS